MKKDSQTVRIKDVQTLADQKGKLTRVTFEQRMRNGDWRQRKREREAALLRARHRGGRTSRGATTERR